MFNSSGPGLAAPEFAVETLAEVDSTNAEALRRARKGARGPLWILAHRQTAARGRRGRVWVTAPGNLAASLLISPDGDPAALAQRSFVAALGLADALDAATGRPEFFRFKWPNDVLLTGSKLAGILLETEGGALVVGFGVNLAAAPSRTEVESGVLRPIALAPATGVRVTPEAFLGLLAPAVARWEGRLAAEGFAPLRTAWLARAKGVGQPVIARLPGRMVRGIFETVDDSGALVLGTGAGRVVLPAAEVHFGDEEGADAARD